MKQSANKKQNSGSRGGEGQKIGTIWTEEADDGDKTKVGSGLFGSLTPGLRFIMAAVFLVMAIIYSIWPIDIIPDILGPVGWVDDVAVWIVVFLLEGSLLLKGAIQRLRSAAQRGRQKDKFI